MSGVAPARPKQYFPTSSGAPLVNGTVDVYLAGTTTRTNTWQDRALSVLNTNPITLDARGECAIWLDPSITYKFVLKDSLGATVYTEDGISGGGAYLGGSGGSALVGFLTSGASAVARTVQDKLRERVSVKDFGAVGDGVTDDTAAFVAARTASKTIEIPDGTYVVSEFKLTAYRNWIGQSEKGVKIIPKPGVTTPLVTLDVGPIPQLHIENIWFDGATAAAGQHCMYLEAQASVDAPFHGGLWYATFRKIYITGFTGHSLWMRGGANGYLLPMQFNTFEQVNVDRGNTTTGRSLLMTGQNGQNVFVNCRFDGFAIGSGTNIELSRDFTNGATSGGATVGGAANGDNAPTTNRFLLTTTQNAEFGFVIDRASDTLIDQPWFENLYRAVKVTTSSSGTEVNHGHFANAASDGVGGGYCVSVGPGCRANGKGNHVLGAYDKTWVGVNGHRGVWFTDSVLDATATAKTSGLTVQMAEVGGTLTTYSMRDLVVNNTTNPITTIDSYLQGGDTITIRALLSYVKFVEGGNLRLPNARPVVLRGSDYIVFKREDLINAWFAVVVNRGRLESAEQPAADYFEQGEFVWNTTAALVAGKVLMGWIRLTTGTSHVPDVDWSECYATNA